MQDLRQTIDDIDRQIIQLIGKRMKLVKQIGRIKQSSGNNIQDKERETLIRSRIKKLARDEALDEQFTDRLYREIFTESRRLQAVSE